MRTASLLLTFVASLAASADSIDDYIRAEMKRQGVPGLSLGVVKDGQVVKAEGYGFSNLEHQVPATRKTVYQSGSVGKQFSAMAAMLLKEEGKLKLDDPVSMFLPGTPDSWKPITVRHLLTHTSGIPEYTRLMDLTKNYTEEELLTKACSLPLEFKPGEKWSYSNTGYAVLGFLMSKAAGKFYGDYMKEKIFKPLGMETARIINEADIIPNRAAGYQYSFMKLKNQSWVAPTLNTTADGSLYLTIDDMIKWDAALAAGKLVSKESYDLMWTPVKTPDGKENKYGFGWMIEKSKGKRRLHHGGSWQGFTTYIDRRPEDKITVIVLTNCAPTSIRLLPGSAPWIIAQKITTTLLPEANAKSKPTERAVGDPRISHF
jgi:D-alanyl-D-alanine carboxypeptidase